jgi:hypothetical protein
MKRTASVTLHGEWSVTFKVDVTDDQMALLKFLEDESENAARKDFMLPTMEVHYIEQTPEPLLEYLQ